MYIKIDQKVRQLSKQHLYMKQNLQSFQFPTREHRQFTTLVVIKYVLYFRSEKNTLKQQYSCQTRPGCYCKRRIHVARQKDTRNSRSVSHTFICPPCALIKVLRGTVFFEKRLDSVPQITKLKLKLVLRFRFQVQGR